MRIVLLHGLACSARSFDRLVPVLRAAGHEAEALDLPGHGSDAGGEGADSIAEMAGAVRDVVREPAVLVGHSLGGLVACAVAEQDPALARRVVCVNTPPTVAARLTAHRGPERLLRTPGLGPLLWRAAPVSRTREGLRTAFGPGHDVPDVFVADARRLSWTTFVRATRAVDEYVAERPLAERLAALGVPATVVFGEEDHRVDPGSLASFPPEVEVVRVPGAGHTPVWEAPGVVGAAITAELHLGSAG